MLVVSQFSYSLGYRCHNQFIIDCLLPGVCSVWRSGDDRRSLGFDSGRCSRGSFTRNSKEEPLADSCRRWLDGPGHESARDDRVLCPVAAIGAIRLWLEIWSA
jgi:hypothetical protein